MTQGSATVVEHEDRLSGYATMIGASGHAVGETTEAVQALIGAAPTFERGSFSCPYAMGSYFAGVSPLASASPHRRRS